MLRRLTDRLRDLWWLFKPLGGAEEDDPRWIRPTVRKRGKTRDHPALVDRAVTARQLERWRNEETLPRHALGESPNAGVRVDLWELDDYLAMLKVPATAGPLVDAPRRLREAIAALASEYEEHPRPGSDVHALLVDISERIDKALQE